MYFDKKNSFATDLAHGGTPEVVDLYHAKMGPGRPILVEVIGNGLTDASGFQLIDGSTSSPANVLAEFTFSDEELNNGVTVAVPQNVDQYLTIALTGTTSAGTYNAGIVLEEGQTNL